MLLSMIALGCSQSILINRVWCMYSRSKAVLVLLLGAFAAQISSSLVVIGLNHNLVSIHFPLTRTLNLCFPTGFSSWFWIFWVFIVIFDTLIFVLALLKGVRHWLDTKHLRRARREAALQHDGAFGSRMTLSLWINGGGGFINVLIRDSIVFPFLSLLICVLNLVSWFGVLPDGWLQISLILAAAASPILGCRLILNLRELYYEPFAEEFRQPKSRRKGEIAPDSQPSVMHSEGGPIEEEERKSSDIPSFVRPAASVNLEHPP
ncbi:hypothetical protein BKA70DRAFT_175323 [Coprinopsis sp. MPI-PUGE-AT-0042]|nr:hypothetical protein BKA70DRAFT_175323 [Coprinopsis sp. MPI-PUGE-AT-0042]